MDAAGQLGMPIAVAAPPCMPLLPALPAPLGPAPSPPALILAAWRASPPAPQDARVVLPDVNGIEAVIRREYVRWGSLAWGADLALPAARPASCIMIAETVPGCPGALFRFTWLRQAGCGWAMPGRPCRRLSQSCGAVAERGTARAAPAAPLLLQLLGRTRDQRSGLPASQPDCDRQVGPVWQGSAPGRCKGKWRAGRCLFCDGCCGPRCHPVHRLLHFRRCHRPPRLRQGPSLPLPVAAGCCT